MAKATAAFISCHSPHKETVLLTKVKAYSAVRDEKHDNIVPIMECTRNILHNNNFNLARNTSITVPTTIVKWPNKCKSDITHVAVCCS